jgi:hypothetical protein
LPVQKPVVLKWCLANVELSMAPLAAPCIGHERAARWDARFDDAFLLRIARGAGVNPEAIILSAFPVGPLDRRLVIASFGDGAFRIVDRHPCWHAVERFECPTMTAKLSGHGLVADKLGILVA